MSDQKTQQAAQLYVEKLSDAARTPLAKLTANWHDLEAAFLAGARWREEREAEVKRDEAVRRAVSEMMTAWNADPA